MLNAILVEKIVDTHLIVNAMGNPDIREAIDSEPVVELVVNDGSKDECLEGVPSENARYTIKEYIGKKCVIYLHLKRLRPVKLCVYRIVA